MANRIKELRIEKRITQLQLSVALGVTQETISAYEHNKHLPSVNSLLKMCEIFDASMDYIMGLSPIRHTLKNDLSMDDSNRDYLLNCYARLSSKNKLCLISYAEGLLDSKNK